MKNTIVESEKKLEALINERAGNIEAAKKKIEAAKEAQEKAAADKAAAIESDNLDAFKQAKEEEATAAAALEMYRAQLTRAAGYNISKEEARAEVERIGAYIDDIGSAYSEIVVSYLEKIQAETDSYLQDCSRAENAGRAWFNTLLANTRDAGRVSERRSYDIVYNDHVNGFAAYFRDELAQGKPNERTQLKTLLEEYSARQAEKTNI